MHFRNSYLKFTFLIKPVRFCHKQSQPFYSSRRVYFVWSLEYLIKKPPVPTQQTTVSLININSCNALLRLLMVYFSIYMSKIFSEIPSSSPFTSITTPYTFYPSQWFSSILLFPYISFSTRLFLLFAYLLQYLRPTLFHNLTRFRKGSPASITQFFAVLNFFPGQSCQPCVQPPTWRPRLSLLAWSLN